jgi:hypothetical protein
MSNGFSAQDLYDLNELFRIYDFSKVAKVSDVVADAESKGMSPAALFDSLYAQYKIQKLPQRDAVAKRLHMAVTTASDADVESVLRQTEMKGFSERDAVRSLERKLSVQHVTDRSLQTARNNLNSLREDAAIGEQSELQRTTSQLRHVAVNDSNTPTLATNTSTNKGTNGSAGGDCDNDDVEPSVIFARPPSHLSAAPTRENLDEVISEEVREWLAKILGDAYNTDVLALPNFIDALRNGVLLHVLLQKMQDPPVADDDLKLPKRTTGFFIRDNVATFLKEAKHRFNLVDAQLFTDSDLVDGKSDRQVVTCLMAMARIAYSAGTIKFAPNIIMYEHEIEQQGTKLTKKDLDRIVEEAEAVEDQSIPTLHDNEDNGKDEVSGADKTLPTIDEGDAGARASPSAEERSPNVTAEAQGRQSAALLSKQASTQNDEVITSESWDGKRASPLVAERVVKAEDCHHSGAAPADTNDMTLPEAVLLETPLDASPPATQECTMSPTKSRSSPDHSAVPVRTSVGEDGATPVSSPAPTAGKEEPTAPSVLSNRDSPRPLSEDLRTPEERGISPVEALNSARAPPKLNDINDDSGDEEGGEDAGDAENEGGGRVFYLRDGTLRPTRPTADEELKLQEQRKKSAPRVVWKSPSSPLAATKPPRYHSRHWDGIDIALGHHLNEHYEKYPKSPWRFHMAASTSGEYVLYSRQSAQKRVVYLRIIQTRLFLRNAGKNQPWVRIEEALEQLENSS